jgi:G:T-mismatch repair DNA endonuclease (very short patch repair protein)
MKCVICDKKFKQNNHLKIHINKHHNINKLLNEINYIKSQIEINDIEFDKIKELYLEGYNVGDLKKMYGVSFSMYIELVGIKRTPSESKKTKIYKDKIESTNLKRFGVKNPSQSIKIKEKKKKTFLKNYGYENNFCNQTIQKKAQECIDYEKAQETLKSNLIEKYGENISNPAQIPGVGKKIGYSQRKRISNMTPTERRIMTEKARSNINYVSSQEIRIQVILNQIGVEYTANGFLYSYNWDLIFKNKIIIEVQGDFWHGNPQSYKETDVLLNGLLVKDVWEKDNRKKKLIESKGYSVHYLWENDINKMTDEEIYNLLKKILC